MYYSSSISLAEKPNNSKANESVIYTTIRVAMHCNSPILIKLFTKTSFFSFKAKGGDDEILLIAIIVPIAVVFISLIVVVSVIAAVK
jgi:hypothetical protein